MKNSVEIFTDGGCHGNPGPGGWAFVIIEDDKTITMDKGGEKNTTNNRMELKAVINALRALKSINKLGSLSQHNATVFTDSQYVKNGITEWIHTWKKNSWKTSGKAPVKNQDLWAELDSLSSELPVSWKWVRGHDGNEYNELCDRMTQEAIAAIL